MSTVNQILKMMQPSGSKLAFRTCFSSVSFNGYKLDILKSAVQKYLRRREFHKMVWCVGEIYLFQVYAKSDTEKRATKGIISNLLNRLIIMLDEEMLFAECEKYLLVRRYMEDFEKSNRGDFECLFNINPIYFDLDKYYIRRDAVKELKKVYTVMIRYPNLKIHIESHTDSRASNKYNLGLSYKF